jgi:hypothetical protein
MTTINNRMHRRAALAAFTLALVGLVAAVPSHGGVDSSQRIELTFSKPIALPGVSLAAGTYVFERAAPNGAVEVVRVSSQDRRFVYYMGFTELVNRPGRNTPAITFGEAGKDAPLPIKEWYPTFASTGHRFLYR